MQPEWPFKEARSPWLRRRANWHAKATTPRSDAVFSSVLETLHRTLDGPAADTARQMQRHINLRLRVVVTSHPVAPEISTDDHADVCANGKHPLAQVLRERAL